MVLDLLVGRWFKWRYDAVRVSCGIPRPLGEPSAPSVGVMRATREGKKNGVQTIQLWRAQRDEEEELEDVWNSKPVKALLLEKRNLWCFLFLPAETNMRLRVFIHRNFPALCESP